MNKVNFAPVYAENNLNWRIRYQCNGRWELQEYLALPEGADRRRKQPWVTHNSNMSYDDAMVLLSSRGLKKVGFAAHSA